VAVRVSIASEFTNHASAVPATYLRSEEEELVEYKAIGRRHGGCRCYNVVGYIWTTCMY
jgi:hypothetical protein